MHVLTAFGTVAALALGGAALAQPADPHAGHGTPGASQAAPGPARAAYEAANERMHKEMAIVYSGDADLDFARSMIPHHRGAVDMARIVLAHGKDPELRKLAQDIVAAQEREIAFLRTWLNAKAQ